MRHRAMQRTQSHGPVVMFGLRVMLSLLKLEHLRLLNLLDRAANVKPALHEHGAVCKNCLQHALGDSWQDSHSAKTGVRK